MVWIRHLDYHTLSRDTVNHPSVNPSQPWNILGDTMFTETKETSTRPRLEVSKSVKKRIYLKHEGHFLSPKQYLSTLIF